MTYLMSKVYGRLHDEHTDHRHFRWVDGRLIWSDFQPFTRGQEILPCDVRVLYASGHQAEELLAAGYTVEEPCPANGFPDERD